MKKFLGTVILVTSGLAFSMPASANTATGTGNTKAEAQNKARQNAAKDCKVSGQSYRGQSQGITGKIGNRPDMTVSKINGKYLATYRYRCVPKG